MKNNIDLTKELGELLGFIANMATAIRMNSAYSHVNTGNRDVDVMWLADSLHNFDSISSAILEGQQERIHFMTTSIISTYKWYMNPTNVDSYRGNPKNTFERWKHLVSLEKGIEILQTIAAKTLIAQDVTQ